MSELVEWNPGVSFQRLLMSFWQTEACSKGHRTLLSGLPLWRCGLPGGMWEGLCLPLQSSLPRKLTFRQCGAGRWTLPRSEPRNPLLPWWPGPRLLPSASISSPSPPIQAMGRLIWTEIGRFVLTNVPSKAVLSCLLLQEALLDSLI